jgi:hypothetical protein
MIAQAALSKAELYEILEERGCLDTREEIETGTIWRAPTGRHFVVPTGRHFVELFPRQGYCPSWMLSDLELIVGKLSPWRKLISEDK